MGFAAVLEVGVTRLRQLVASAGKDVLIALALNLCAPALAAAQTTHLLIVVGLTTETEHD